MAWIFFFCLFLLAAYLWFIGNLMGFVPALREGKRPKPFASGPASVVVLIPFRNELDHLPALIGALNAQRLPAGLALSILWINDHSTDGGEETLSRQSMAWPSDRLSLPVELTGKKAALRMGLAEAKADWIMCTDADVIPSPDWIARMVAGANHQGWDFATGLVRATGNNLIQRLQTWDMVAMMAITWLGWRTQWWYLANGASLLVRRDAALKTGAWESDGLASGDDLFLVHRLMASGYRGGMVANPEAMVSTQALPNWKQLWQQRKRWASKLSALPGQGMWLLGSFLLLVAWIPWILLVAGWVWKPAWIPAGMFFLAIKGLADAWLLRMLGWEFGQRFRFWDLLWLLPMHAWLLLGSSFFSLAGRKYHWKGRKVS